MTSFRKMHGLGNDFAVFDARKSPIAWTAGLAKKIADRRRGIGCDQILIIEPSKTADAFMRIYNADGGEVESCGNGVRCVARVLLEETGKKSLAIESLGAIMQCSAAQGGLITVDMGAPHRDWREIPMAQAVETENFAIAVPGYQDAALANASAVSMGNPHLVLFVNDAETAPLDTLGKALETHAWFPKRTNVEFISALGPQSVRMRVWERGSGITQACGTGACAVAVAAAARGLTGRNVAVELDGGRLDIAWRESDNHVLMTGPATLSYTGEIDMQAYA